MLDPLTFALRAVEPDDDLVTLIGPEAAGTLIGVVIWWVSALAIAHALRPAREAHVSRRGLGEAPGTSGEAVRKRYHAF